MIWRRLKHFNRGSATAVALTFALTLLAVGCDRPAESGGDEGASTSNSQRIDESTTADSQRDRYLDIRQLELSEAAIELHPDTLSDVVLEEDRIVVPSDSLDRWNEFSEGDILVSDVEGGFLRYVEGRSRDGGKIVYRTRRAELDEAFSQLSFTFTSAPQAIRETDDGEVVSRQALTKDYSKSFTFSKDFSTAEQLQVAGQDVEVQASGDIWVQPGFFIEVDVLGDNLLNRITGKVFAPMELNASWRLGVNEGEALTQIQTGGAIRYLPLCSGSGSALGGCDNGKPYLQESIPFAGDIRVELYARIGYRWSGAGGGFVEGGFTADGRVMGGVEYITEENDFRTLKDWDASAESIDWDYGGQMDLEAAAQIELGAKATLGDTKILHAIPFQGTFSSTARIDPPTCSVRGKLDVLGEVRTGGPLGDHRYELYSETPVNSVVPEFSDIDGCTNDNTAGQETCTSDNDCGNDEQCRQGYCIHQAPMEIVLDWAGDTELNLYVENPDGETVQLSGGPEEQDSETGWMAIRTDGSASSGTTNAEIALFDRIRPQATYRIWVENTGSTDAANYSVRVMRRGAEATSIEGSDLEAGGKSVDYLYNSGEVEGRHE